MPIELATGYVSIVPSAQGMKGQLATVMNGPSKAAGVDAGKQMGVGLTSGIKGALASIKKDAASLKVGIAGAALVGIGVGIERALKSSTAAAKEYGSEVVLLQRLTGGTAKESSLWAAILGRMNVTGKQAALVIKSLSTAIADDSADLAALNIATKNADGTNRDSMEVLGDLAEAYKNADNKADVLARGTSVLGRGFASLLPVLASGKKGIEDLAAAAEANGLIFDDGDIETVKAYNKALKNNAEAMKGVAVQVGLATLPFKTFQAEALGKTYKWLRDINPELAKFAGAVGPVAGPVAKAAGSLLLFVAAVPFIKTGFATLGLAGILETIAIKGMYAADALAVLAASPLFVATGIVATIFGLGLGLAYLEDKTAKASMSSAQYSERMKTQYQRATELGRATGAVTTLHQGNAAATEASTSTLQRHRAELEKTAQVIWQYPKISEELKAEAQTAAKAAVALALTEAQTASLAQAEVDALTAVQSVAQARADLTAATKTYGATSGEAAIAAANLALAESQVAGVTSSLIAYRSTLNGVIAGTAGQWMQVAQAARIAGASELTAFRLGEIADINERGAAAKKIGDIDALLKRLGSFKPTSFKSIGTGAASAASSVTKMSDAIKTAVQGAKSLAEQFKNSAHEIANFSGLFQRPESNRSKGGFVSNARSQVRKLGKYRDALAKLSKTLPAKVFDEVVGSGTSSMDDVIALARMGNVGAWSKLIGQRQSIAADITRRFTMRGEIATTRASLVGAGLESTGRGTAGNVTVNFNGSLSFGGSTSTKAAGRQLAAEIDRELRAKGVVR